MMKLSTNLSYKTSQENSINKLREKRIWNRTKSQMEAQELEGLADQIDL
jgi:hypothetical protein